MAEMIRELVPCSEEIALPGLGVFVVEEVPAAFSDRGYTVNPPYLRLAFRQAPGRPRIRAVGNFGGSVHDLKVLEYGEAAILSFQSPNDPVMPYGEGYPFRTRDRGLQVPSQWFSEPMFGTEAIYERAKELGLRVEHHACPEPRHRLHLDDDGQFTERFYEIRDRMAAFFAEEF